MATCNYCEGGQVLEIRVQPDQKIYVDCICNNNTLQQIACEAFTAGYKRAEDDRTVEASK